MYNDFNIVKDWLPIGASNRPGDIITPDGLVIHWTANINYGSGADANAGYFLTLARQGGFASAHYTLDDTKIRWSIPENEMAYHVGADTYYTKAFGTYPNRHLLGLEICVPADGDWKATYDHAVRFAAAICKKYGWTDVRKHLVRHYDITHKDCPLMMLDLVHDKAHVEWSVREQLRWVAKAKGQAEFERRVAEGIEFINNMAIDGCLGQELWDKFNQDVSDAITGKYPKTIEEKVVYHMGKYFADIDGHWSENIIDGLHEEKLADGTSLFAGSTDANGKLVARPDAFATRAEMATLMSRAIKYAIEQVKK